MTKTIEIKATAMVQEHLNRDPRVICYRDSARWGDGMFEVDYDPYIACPVSLKINARQLGIEF
jgi:hypothetical protein